MINLEKTESVHDIFLQMFKEMSHRRNNSVHLQIINLVLKDKIVTERPLVKKFFLASKLYFLPENTDALPIMFMSCHHLGFLPNPSSRVAFFYDISLEKNS